MTLVASVLTTKAGQGSSTLALSLAWAAAERHRVLLCDADMSGTGNLAELLALDCGSRGIGNLFGTQAVSPALIEQQVVRVPSRPHLRVLAGLQGFCGPGVAELLPRLVPALRALPDELVLLDLGAPLAHPGQESPRRAAEAVCTVSQRVLIALQDGPPRLIKSIQVLKAARPPQAELILFQTRGGALREQIRRTLAEHLPGVRVAAVLPWDERRAIRCEDHARAVPQPGLLEALELLPVRAAGRR